MKYIVVGMGNFGAFLAARLTDLGHDVIGVDSDEAKIEAVKDKITHTIVMNATDTQAIKTLPLKDTDVVVIAIGEDFGASIMSTAIFKQLKAKRIIGRAISTLHETVIQAIGVDEIIHPEEETAERLAKRLQMKGVLDSFDVSEDYNIIEVEVPERYVGMTIAETNIRNEYNINILTIIKLEERPNIFGIKSKKRKVVGVVAPDTQLEKGDIILIFGHVKDVRAILELDK